MKKQNEGFERMSGWDMEQNLELIKDTVLADYEYYDKKADRLEFWLDKLTALEDSYSDTEERYNCWVEVYDRVTERFDEADITRVGLNVYFERLTKLANDIVTFYADIRPE